MQPAELPRLSDEEREAHTEGYPQKAAVTTCQEGRCNHQVKYLSPSGLPICGMHRRSIDAWYERLQRAERCVELNRQMGIKDARVEGRVS